MPEAGERAADAGCRNLEDHRDLHSLENWKDRANGAHLNAEKVRCNFALHRWHVKMLDENAAR